MAAPSRREGRTQVLVVGAGPAGLVAALVLARYGVRVLLVEKRVQISTLSRALVISTRSMELLRSWGLEERVRSGAADVEPRAWVSRTLASAEGRELPLGYPTAAEAEAVSPTRPAWAPQDHLEPLLLERVTSMPTVTVRFGLELVGLRQGEVGVRAVLRRRDVGQTEQVGASYVIGADGAHSLVRSELGIAMEGRDDLAEYHRVEFLAPLLEVVGRRRYGLYVVTHPDASAVLSPRGAGDRWGLAREWRPGQPRTTDYDDERLLGLVRTAAGVTDLPVQVERTSSFAFAAQIADRYGVGRCFLVGDAAHRMTPRGGTGMNTAIQDAYDIAWKLGWVLNGWARPELLGSYEAERRPIGVHNVRRTGGADGATREASQALPWDLDGRLAHRWLPRDGEKVSTLDLVGEGLTLLTGPDADAVPGIAGGVRSRVPVGVHHLDAETASALGVPRGGALLLRPDAKQVSSPRLGASSLDLGGLPVT